MLADELFCPSAPGPRRLTPWRRLQLAVTRSIESWPPAVFEEPFYRPPLPGAPLFVMDPVAIHEVLVHQAETFVHGALWRRITRPIWGRGLAVSEGAEWARQRRLAAPAFRPAEMKQFGPVASRAAERLLKRWRLQGPEVVQDVYEGALLWAFDAFVDSFFSPGKAEGLERNELLAHLRGLLKQAGTMRLSYFLAPDAHHDGRPSPAAANLTAFRQGVRRLICASLENGGSNLTRSLTTDPDLLEDNVSGYLAAGHDTSAVSLAWAVFLASSDLSIAAALRAEAKSVIGEGPLQPEHVEQLVSTRQVICEALRLYPPAYMMTRVCTGDARLGPHVLKSGDRVVIPTYALHRHRRWWTEPDAFKPSRFAPSASPPDRHLYMPFGAGPRICIGAAFAITELTAALATLFRSARFELAGEPPWPITDLSLRPLGGLPMKITIDGEVP
ncbi:cytochrome P450 [Phenylobacterium deserti]|nr:cytochrome P450 [Phenylobacterium deserti]